MTTPIEKKLAEATDLDARAEAAEKAAKAFRHAAAKAHRAVAQAQFNRDVNEVRADHEFTTGEAKSWITLTSDLDGEQSIEHYSGINREHSIALTTQDLIALRDHLNSLGLD